MTDHRSRFPGAQPFADDDLSQKVFFGRDDASKGLTDKILTNRLVVVYGRSGLGKTSLLKAGVAPRLRAEHHLPLFVRVNDVQTEVLQSTIEDVATEAKRQQIEYSPGLVDSLWSFFKTAEFWRDDFLMTPILILDQFEELFTLQSTEMRTHFLDQLSHLIRGVRPPWLASSSAEDLSVRPPAVHVVLSLREDFLGLLEEGADHIPQILDVRYRLVPLDFQAAQQAIVGPLGVDDIGLETKPFSLEDDAVNSILDYLSQRRTNAVSDTKAYIEPFHLQLICRRIEQIAAAQQQSSNSSLPVSMEEIGGEVALAATLKDFYHDTISTLPGSGQRRACRRLCEDYLISPEGRRLSLEENEIRRQLSMTKEELANLVGSRLLRSDNRSDSTYYELSHDALIEPILSTKRKKNFLLGWSGIILGVLSSVFLIFLAIGSAVALIEIYKNKFPSSEEVLGFSILIVFMLLFAIIPISLIKIGGRSVLRYRQFDRNDRIDIVYKPPSQLDFLIGLFILIFGITITMMGLLTLGVLIFIILASKYYDMFELAKQVDLAEYVENLNFFGFGVDTIVYFVASAAAFVTGMRLIRWAIYQMTGYRNSRSLKSLKNSPEKRTAFSLLAKILLGIILSVSTILLFTINLLTARCYFISAGSLPGWIPQQWFSFLITDCINWEQADAVGELVIGLPLSISLLVVTVRALREAFAAIGNRSLRAL